MVKSLPKLGTRWNKLCLTWRQMENSTYKSVNFWIKINNYRIHSFVVFLWIVAVLEPRRLVSPTVDFKKSHRSHYFHLFFIKLINLFDWYNRIDHHQPSLSSWTISGLLYISNRCYFLLALSTHLPWHVWLFCDCVCHWYECYDWFYDELPGLCIWYQSTLSV